MKRNIIVPILIKMINFNAIFPIIIILGVQKLNHRTKIPDSRENFILIYPKLT